MFLQFSDDTIGINDTVFVILKRNLGRKTYRSQRRSKNEIEFSVENTFRTTYSHFDEFSPGNVSSRDRLSRFGAR